MSAKIVIDCGCADQGSETSIRALIDRFQPKVLFGFDPAESMSGMRRKGYRIGGTRVEISSVAAWTREGTEPMWLDGARGTLCEYLGHGEPRQVETISLGRFILDLAEPVVVKIDIEGGEYRLISHLIATNATEHVERVLVEWHHLDIPIHEKERGILERVLGQLKIPVEEWR